MNKNKNISEIKRVTWVGVIVNLGLSILKFIVGTKGNSQAVIADAFHSVSDISTDLAVIFGIKFWSAPPDKNHPFGHKKIETIITAGIGLVLTIVAFTLAYNAIVSIGESHVQQTSWIALIGPILSLVLKEILYRWTIATGRKTRSSAVIANAWHHRSDAISSIPALISVIAASINPKWWFVDHIGAIVISIFIFKTSYNILSPALAGLTDHGATEKERSEIHDIALSVKGVEEAHAIRTRRLSDSIFVDMHILVDPAMTVFEGHEISEKVKLEILGKGPNVIDVVVHIEPSNDKPET